MRSISLLSACSLAALSTATLAQSGHRQLGAHEHGAGTLNVAVDGKSVGMELEVPGADIVGFEHAPSTAEQKSQLAAAKEKLAKGLELFRLSDAAGCKITGSEVDYATEDHKAVHREEEAGESSKHDHDHASHDEGSEGDEHDSNGGHDHGHAQHAEFRAAYSIECTAPEALREITFEYFKAFENAERLVVNVVTGNGQSSHEAMRASPKVSFAP